MSGETKDKETTREMHSTRLYIMELEDRKEGSTVY